jgi:hypothetical protein
MTRNPSHALDPSWPVVMPRLGTCLLLLGLYLCQPVIATAAAAAPQAIQATPAAQEQPVAVTPEEEIGRFRLFLNYVRFVEAAAAKSEKEATAKADELEKAGDARLAAVERSKASALRSPGGGWWAPMQAAIHFSEPELQGIIGIVNECAQAEAAQDQKVSAAIATERAESNREARAQLRAAAKQLWDERQGLVTGCAQQLQSLLGSESYQKFHDQAMHLAVGSGHGRGLVVARPHSSGASQ